MSHRSRQLALVVVCVAGLGELIRGEQPAAPAGDAATKAPFELTVAEQAQVDQILAAWERIDTFGSRFVYWHYDLVWSATDKPRKEGAGEVRFARPDKLLWRVDEPDPEQWIFDCQTVREFRFAKRMVIDHRVPADMQRGRLWEGAVPFVFGDEPAKLKERYWMRITTPEKQVGKFIHVELHPRTPTYFFLWGLPVARPTIDVIVTDPGLMPYAVQVRHSNGKQRPA